ncbi:hypothetical protein [Burkholderia sp. LMG 32019]|uniref:hypothetical protein n=1 Tax=Burkholderia sp. LMG 32019 TaxID=3158173 RepID=UPI003C2BAF07
MNGWITLAMIHQIIRICDLISRNDFVRLEAEGNFEVSTPSEIRAGVLEYLGGDFPRESDLVRIGVPDENYVRNHSIVYEINPSSPSDRDKRIQINLIIDGVESDLTLILHAHKREGGDEVRVYGALTL